MLMAKHFTDGEQVIQIMPVASINDDTAIQRRELYSDPRASIYIVGLALTNRGNLYPIAYDGVMTFEVYDPVIRSFANSIERSMENQKNYNAARKAVDDYKRDPLNSSYDDARLAVSLITDNSMREELGEELYQALVESYNIDKEKPDDDAAADLPFDD